MARKVQIMKQSSKYTARKSGPVFFEIRPRSEKSLDIL